MSPRPFSDAFVLGHAYYHPCPEMTPANTMTLGDGIHFDPGTGIVMGRCYFLVPDACGYRMPCHRTPEEHEQKATK